MIEGIFGVNRKIAFLRASMVITYDSNFFRTGAHRHNSVLMSLFLVVEEAINKPRILSNFEQQISFLYAI